MIVLGGGNTAMDCCRSSRRLGGEDVKVIVRSGFEEMKARPWEKEDAMHEGIPILNYLVPKAFLHDGAGSRACSSRGCGEYDDERGRRKLVPTGEPDQAFECDDVLVAVGQENAFPWIERDMGLDFDESGMPVVDPVTLRRRGPTSFSAASGPGAEEHHLGGGPRPRGGDLDRPPLPRRGLAERPPPGTTLASQKMGIHEWSYDNQVAARGALQGAAKSLTIALRDIREEVELGFDPELAWKEAQRCLNCDVQTVFTPRLCIECDACVDICPMDCITFTADGEEGELRARLNAPALDPTQDLYVSGGLKTGRIMAKDEDVCLHCGLCAERCPTGAWDMQKFLFEPAHAGPRCRQPAAPGRSPPDVTAVVRPTHRAAPAEPVATSPSVGRTPRNPLPRLRLQGPRH